MAKATIREVRIRNCMGVSDMEIHAGKLVRISGSNATGKSSIVEGIRAVLKGGGHDKNLLTIGEEDGEVLIVLDDGTEVSKRLGPKSSPITVRDPSGQRVASPVEFLQKCFDVMATNPVVLLDASASKRLEMFAEAIGRTPTLEELQDAVAAASVNVSPEGGEAFGYFLRYDPALSGIAMIRAVLKELTAWRRAVGQRRKEREAGAKRLAGSLPEGKAESPADIDAKIEVATDAVESIGTEEARAKKAALHIINEKNQEDIGLLRQNISDLEKKLAHEKAALAAKETAMGREGEASLETIAEKYETEAAARRSELRTLQEAMNTAKERANTRKILDDEEEAVHDLRTRYEAFTEAIENVRGMRAALLSAININGVDIDLEGGDILVDGVPWDKVNTARKMVISFEVAGLRGGRVCIMDQADALDTETLAALEETAAAMDIQLWVLIVTDEPLSVQSDLF